ncbi:MAG TPA: LytTR family DNA-binding domain-containing protein [Gemmatimonadaceae bacterium]|nr:LytTR family DNA-binding domain-containing protein [Gemmatimonadaceae bacterium]
MSAKPLRVLIVDDEPLARQRIEDLLAHEQGIEILGTADNGDRAIEKIRAQQPDLVFLDVQMPGMTGLDVVRSVGVDAMPPTIFVTAYDQHALKAFELAALDYLVKPFDDERFEQALARGRAHAELREARALRERLRAMLDGDAAAVPSNYIQRIPVESRGKVQYVPVEQIDYIAASGPYAEIVVGTRRHLVRETMQSLEESLDPARFMRVHRSAIVPLDRVETLFRGAGGDYELQLKNGTRIRVSRARREDVEERLKG